MKNSFGLDVHYFRKKLQVILNDIELYSPEELHRELGRLAKTAKPKNVCRHGESLEGLCNACSDSGFDPRN